MATTATNSDGEATSYETIGGSDILTAPKVLTVTWKKLVKLWQAYDHFIAIHHAKVCGFHRE